MYQEKAAKKDVRTKKQAKNVDEIDNSSDWNPLRQRMLRHLSQRSRLQVLYL